MQSQPERAIGAVGAYGPVREWRIADGEVEARRQLRAGKISSEDPGPRLQQPDDACGDGIELDAGDVRQITKRFRHQRRKQARADPRLQHPAAAPSETLQARPDRPDDEFRCEMGILGAAGKRGIVGLADGILQIGTDFVPALAEFGFARTAEDAVGKIRRTEAGEADQRLLFLARRRTIARLDLGSEPDRGNVVARTVLPAAGKLAVIGEMEIQATGTARRGRRPHDRGDRQGRGWSCGIRIVVGLEVAAEGRHAQAERGRKRSVAEKIDCEGIVM